MNRVRLIHWSAAEAEERGASLRPAGHLVESSEMTAEALRELRSRPPDAFVIKSGLGFAMRRT
jgi:hypothetical protein